MAKEDRGFASMDRAKQREIASKGGKAAHQKGTAHEWTSEEAREAGRKGGMASHRRRSEHDGKPGDGDGTQNLESSDMSERDDSIERADPVNARQSSRHFIPRRPARIAPGRFFFVQSRFPAWAIRAFAARDATLVKHWEVVQR